MNIIDYIVLILAVAIVLFIGWSSGKAGQKKSAREFLMAGSGINKLQAGFSMAATDFGGSGLVGAIGYAYVVGMSGAWWNLAAAPAFILVGLFLAKKFYRMNSATLPEFLGKRYSGGTRILATIMQILSLIAALAVQFTVSSTVLHVITGFNQTISLVISIAVVLFLTSGGLKAVVNTDSALFVIIVLSVLVSVPITIHAAGGFAQMSVAVPADFFRMDSLGAWTPISWVLLCILTYSTNQMYVQRMVVAKDEGTAVFGALFTATFYVIISIALGLIGIAASVVLPGIEDTNTIFPQLLMNFFPHGLQGLGLAAVFAATISTGTSVLHAITTLFVNDIYIPIWGKQQEEQKQYIVSKLTVVVIAVFAFVIAVFSGNIVNVLYIGGLFYGVSAFMPMVLGLSTKFVTGKAAFVSIIVSVACALIWEYFPQIHGGILAAFPSNLFGVLVSAVVLCLVSLLTNNKN